MAKDSKELIELRAQAAALDAERLMLRLELAATRLEVERFSRQFVELHYAAATYRHWADRTRIPEFDRLACNAAYNLLKAVLDKVKP